MRFIVYGAGSIGGVVGGRLAQAGQDVVLIARGAHREAIDERGLAIQDADGTEVVRVRTAGRAADVDWRGDDVGLLAVKSQDTASVLTDLLGAAPPSVAIVCMQNGLDNEREALRRFASVYGAHVALPATYLSPGLVVAHSAPITGILDIGRYPTGVDATTAEIAAALTGARFSSEVVDDVMAWKRRKLIINLTNAVDAICGAGPETDALRARLRDEGERALAAAGLSVVSAEVDRRRRAGVLTRREVPGQPRSGNSTWQSMAKGGSIETDYLNGEIALLGRTYGVPVEANAALQRLAAAAARAGAAPGSGSAASVLALIPPG